MNRLAIAVRLSFVNRLYESISGVRAGLLRALKDIAFLVALCLLVLPDGEPHFTSQRALEEPGLPRSLNLPSASSVERFLLHLSTVVYTIGHLYILTF